VIALTDGEIRVEMEAQRETLRKTAARNRSVDAYNAAIALYNERDYERALAAFQKLAAESPDPELAASAKARASEVSRLVGREAPKP
jgi:TolA-binding protein